MTDILGKTDPAFKAVSEMFAANFAEDSAFPEVGAAVNVHIEGKQVVDLWGGIADQTSGREFDADTLVHLFSTSKMTPAIAIAQLVDKGLINYSDAVAKHWPEFAHAGKENITIAQVLSHQSGVNAFEEPISMDEMVDWELATSRLAAQSPAYTPGEKSSYHATTFGHLAMEVVRRVTGLSPSQYVQQHIAAPVNADLFVGAAEKDWSRIATLIPPQGPPPARPDMDPVAMKALLNPMIIPPMTASASWRNAMVPAINCHGSARGLAKVYSAIVQTNEAQSSQLLSSQAVEAMCTPLSAGSDMLMGPLKWGAGVILNNDENLLGPEESTFGNIGFGGSFAIANTELSLSAAYAPNRLFPNLLQDPRAMALRNVIFECAGKAGA